MKERLEVSPQKRPLTKAQARSGRERVESESVFCGNLQISFLAGGELAANFTREGEGHANEGWFIDKDVVSKICKDFNDVLFETVVKSS